MTTFCRSIQHFNK